ncbi:Lysyl-tRNA synthetase [Corchorus olitorius]|uniref:Lysyl-tRNA synthetase n=1 Tax=Corchorus olitorius TaxID=93759 RepID=A0A1R3HPS3_9ROSI|nr:Lysyl-tRNA synthetase [Corchorus olitorius]
MEANVNRTFSLSAGEISSPTDAAHATPPSNRFFVLPRAAVQI